VVDQYEHPTDEEIAAFLDGALPPSERRDVSVHLAECDDCRALLGAAHDERRTGSTMVLRRPRRWSAGAIAAAAAAVVMVGVALRTQRAVAPADGVRGSRAPAAEEPLLRAQSPVGGASLLGDTLVLRWDAAGDGASYDVSIFDAGGSVVWKAHVDTVAIAPPDDVKARLRAGERYHWQVDALLPDLRTTTTGLQEFIPLAR
jgi:hypothetical protein